MISPMLEGLPHKIVFCSTEDNFSLLFRLLKLKVCVFRVLDGKVVQPFCPKKFRLWRKNIVRVAKEITYRKC